MESIIISHFLLPTYYLPTVIVSHRVSIIPFTLNASIYEDFNVFIILIQVLFLSSSLLTINSG